MLFKTLNSANALKTLNSPKISEMILNTMYDAICQDML